MSLPSWLRTAKQEIGRLIIPRVPLSQRSFRILRFELNALATRALSSISPQRRMKLQRLRQKRRVNLNLGSGGRGRTGWVNIDVMRHHDDTTFAHDIRKRLPLANGQVARIFAEHVIEHIPFRDGTVKRVMEEFYRVLEPGGMVRVIVPDTERWIEAYATGDVDKWAALGMEELPDDMPTRMAMINHVFHQDGEHRFAYDFETLEYVMEEGGFEEVEKMEYGRSEDPELCLDREIHAPYSMYVESRK